MIYFSFGLRSWDTLVNLAGVLDPKSHACTQLFCVDFAPWPALWPGSLIEVNHLRGCNCHMVHLQRSMHMSMHIQMAQLVKGLMRVLLMSSLTSKTCIGQPQ